MSYPADMLVYTTRSDFDAEDRKYHFAGWWFLHFGFAPNDRAVMIREGMPRPVPAKNA